MNPDSSLFLGDQNSDSSGDDLLFIALVGPNHHNRKAVASAISGCECGKIREYSSYPSSLDEFAKLLKQRYDVIVIDLDSDPESALELVESACAKSAATVMVYSEKPDSELLVR